MIIRFSTLVNRESIIKRLISISKTTNQLKQTHALFLKLQQHKPNKPRSKHHHLLIRLFLKLLRLPKESNTLSYAYRLFDQIPDSNLTQFRYTSFIRYNVRHTQFSTAISLYSRLHKDGILPSGYVFSSVLNACSRVPAILTGKQVHARVFTSGFLRGKVVETALLDMYGKCGEVFEARKIFDEMSERDVVAWTAVIRGYTKMGMMDSARRLFNSMEERNVVCWTTMIAGYANSGDMNGARELYDQMPGKHAVAWLAMIAGYGKLGDVGKAREVFDEAWGKDGACWAAMIACYAQNGCAKEAVDMFKDMRKENAVMSEVAVVAAISACTQLADVKMAEELAEYVEQGCCSRTTFVSTALIHMHSKCGSIDRAWKEFNGMKNKDAISYSTLLTALADHGRAREALKLFHLMLKEGIEPNQVTFISLLSACSHAGLVEEGCRYFSMMTKVFGMKPLVEHYATMIDLLGRAGHLEKAYNLIINGGDVCDAGVWTALLGACRVHMNSELGEIVARRLFEIEPEDTANYLLLAGIYASVGRWEDADKLKKLIGLRRLKKSPGCSFI